MADRLSLLDYAIEAAQLGREALATGDNVTGIAALHFAAQCLQLARIMERMKPLPPL